MPSRIRPLSTMPTPWAQEGVGEVYGGFRAYQKPRPIPFLTYDHVCGTPDDFAEGGTVDEDLPPVEYDRDGLPRCCNPPFVGDGGGGASGTAAVTVGIPYAQFYLFTYPPFSPGPTVTRVGTTNHWQYIGPGGTVVGHLYGPGVVISDWFAALHIFPSDWQFSYPASWDGTGTVLFTETYPNPGFSTLTVQAL